MDFRNFAQALNPKVNMPCEATLYTELMIRKAEMLLIIEEIVGNNPRALTTDSWTSKRNKSFTAFTQDVITPDWDLVSLSLDCIKHIGIAVCIDHKCQKLKIEPSAVITDCEPSMVAAGRKLQFPHGGCIDHRLEIVTKLFFDGPGVSDSMKVARNVAGHYNHSS